MRPSLLLYVVLILAPLPAMSQLGDIVNRAESTMKSRNAAGLSDSKIASGLKEALEVSTSKAVASTGRPNGFLKNQAIRITLPDKLNTLGKGLRIVGMGAKVDELEVAMNRAAEQATPAAKAIFISALKKMTFDDARRILSGNDTAAADYFKRTSSSDLTTAFTPIVNRSMKNVGVMKQYNSMVQSAPGGAALAGSFDINKYVVAKTLDGLFYMLGQEEQKIRKNPAAQTTSLLKEVFGRG